MENVTLLPELVATELVNCVQYLRMDIWGIFINGCAFNSAEINEIQVVNYSLVGSAWSCRFWIRTHGLCPRPEQTRGQNPDMSRLTGQVYNQTKSADLLETRADRTGLRRRQGRRHGSPTKFGRVLCSGILGLTSRTLQNLYTIVHYLNTLHAWVLLIYVQIIIS